MHGSAVMKLPLKERKPEVVTLTPELAAGLLEHNGLNRPLSDVHVQRIANQIKTGKWQFNGDTIKVADTGDILDGQHRLWAVIEAKKPVETIVVYGVKSTAFSTIDTLRRPRSGADVLALNGAHGYRMQMAQALMWLMRWQRECLESWKAPQNKLENSDIETAYAAHPNIVRATQRAMQLRSVANPSVMAFLYYILANRDAALAERMMATLEDPAGVGVNDPFFRLRAYFTADAKRRKDALMTIALTFKAANAAKAGTKIQSLFWKSQGKAVEPFPKLEF